MYRQTISSPGAPDSHHASYPKIQLRFAPGDDGTKLLRDTEDMFTLELEELRLVFEKIEKA